MELISNFYNTLFAIEVTVYMAIATIIIVFLQIVNSQHSYREINVLFKSFIFILLIIMSVITIAFTSYASLTLTFSNQSFFNFDLIKNESIASINLLIFIITLIIFITYVLINIKYLRPSHIALMISKKIKPKMIMYFILKKFGLPKSPIKDSELSIFSNEELDGMIDIYSKNLLDAGDEIKLKGYELKKNRFRKEIRKTQDKYQSLLHKVNLTSDPLEPLHALTIRAISNSDFKVLDDIKFIVTKISNDFFFKYCLSTSNTKWDSCENLTTKYIKYLIEMLDIYIDMFDTLSFNYGKIKVLEISNAILTELLQYDCTTKEIEVLLNFWKNNADRSITKTSKIFIYIFELYYALLDILFNDFYDSRKDILDVIFRHIGWLGERLLTLKQIEHKPFMYDSDYSNEYDQLINILCRSCEYYMKHADKEYPLIFFDAVNVVFMKYINLYTHESIKNEDVYSYIDICSSFAKEAIKNGNRSGASIAILRLNGFYKELIEKKLNECAKSVIVNFIEICGLYLIYKDSLHGENVLSDPMDQYLIKIIEVCPYIETISTTMVELFRKSSGNNGDTTWNFVTVLGKRMQTNFGMMFDWQTGLRYSDDDPRRK